MAEWRFANFAFKVSRIWWLTIQYDVARCFTQDELQLLRGQSSCRESGRPRSAALENESSRNILHLPVLPPLQALKSHSKLLRKPR